MLAAALKGAWLALPAGPPRGLFAGTLPSHTLLCTAHHSPAQELSLSFCTSNLHHLVCMLTAQAEARGDTRHFFELFVERGIQFLKRRTKFRSTSKPESVIANGLGLGSKLHDLQQQSTAPILSLADLLSGRASSSASASSASASACGSGSSDSKASADEDGSFLLDAGVLLRGGDAEAVVGLMVQEFCSGQGAVGLWGGWTEDMLRSEFVRVYVHGRASLGDEELVTSREYKRAKVRDSTHVLVPYVGADEVVQQWVGQVQRFVRFEFVGEGGGEAVRPLRVALVDFFEYTPPVEDEYVGVVHKVLLGGDGLLPVANSSFPVRICSISCKLIYANGVARVGRHAGQRVRYLAPYNHLSGLL